MRASERRLTALGIGLLAYFIVRRPSKQRRRARREAIYQSYELAGADPAFMTEHQALTRELDGTAADGLDPGATDP
jgi:hypothetical protein